MKQITISIPDMQSSHCRSRVEKALKAIQGIQHTATEPGEATFEYESEYSKSTALQTITMLGYHPESETAGKVTKHYNTNINCSGCVAKVQPVLDADHAIETWQVDTTTKDKILTVTMQAEHEAAMMEQVRKAGFKIEPKAE